ncbi:MAG: DUF1735 domain-containing protein [Paludibacter sp.]|nr:DUF1735 domain-containing protein [Paludibacter sp.]
MKQYQKYLISFQLLITIILLSGCNQNFDYSKNASIYMHKPEISNSFDVTDTIEYQATFVGADYPTALANSQNDVTIHFKADTNLVAGYNSLNGTSYKTLPAANYTLQASGAIAKGQAATSGLKLILSKGDALEAFATYLLPVTIDNVQGAELSPVQKTTYFIVTRTPSIDNLPHFDRSKWTISGFSSQEPGEGDGTNDNGLAIAAIDGVVETYWHSKWDPDDVPPPHYITIDMGETKMLHGISYICRQFTGDGATSGHGQPKIMTISLSTDGLNWTNKGPFNLALPPVDNQVYENKIAIPNTNARYFKLTVTSPWNAPGTSLAEIYAL